MDGTFKLANFEFLKYYRDGKTDDYSLKMVLSENSKYVQDGFIDKWMNNFGKVTSSGNYSYGMHRNVVVRSEDSSYVADIDKDKIPVMLLITLLLVS